MDRFGYAKTVDVSVYERNKEAICQENKYVFSVMNTDKICIFTDTGRLHLIKVQNVPFGKFRDKGTPIDNLCNYSSAQEQMVQALSLQSVKMSLLLFGTKQGMLKQVEGVEFDVSKRTVVATKLQDGDELLFVSDVRDTSQLVLQTKEGYFLRFPISEVPMKKKGAVGVRGIRLSKEDQVEKIYTLDGTEEATAEYKDRTVHLNRLRIGRRDTKGTKARS